MIGAAKTALSTSFTPAAYGASISPSFKTVITLNGAATSPNFSAIVSGGVGPFDYLWEIDNNKINISTSDQDKTSFSCSGYNTEIEGDITLTITDTGNGNAETTATGSVLFLFGTLP